MIGMLSAVFTRGCPGYFTFLFFSLSAVPSLGFAWFLLQVAVTKTPECTVALQEDEEEEEEEEEKDAEEEMVAEDEKEVEEVEKEGSSRASDGEEQEMTGALGESNPHERGKEQAPEARGGPGSPERRISAGTLLFSPDGLLATKPRPWCDALWRRCTVS